MRPFVRATLGTPTDHLLDLGFRKDMEKIVDCLPHQRQSLLFSATIPNTMSGYPFSMSRCRSNGAETKAFCQSTHYPTVILSKPIQPIISCPLNPSFASIFVTTCDSAQHHPSYTTILLTSYTLSSARSPYHLAHSPICMAHMVFSNFDQSN